MESEKIRVLERIAKLRALASNAAASENEAATALRMAAKLMREHGIAEAEAVLAGEVQWEFKTYVTPDGGKRPRTKIFWMGYLALGISRFTDTVGRRIKLADGGVVIVFSGVVEDARFAAYLMNALTTCVRRESATYQGTRHEKESFRIGMVDRLNKRMVEARAAAEQDTAATNTAMIVFDMKSAEVARRYGVVTAKARSVEVCERAMADGYEAGGGPSINRPLETETANVRGIACSR